MLQDIPRTWFESLTWNTIFQAGGIILVFCILVSILIGVALLLTDLKLKYVALAPVIVLSISTVFIVHDISLWNYVLTDGLETLKKDHYIINQYEAQSVFELSSKDFALNAYSVSLKPVERLSNIPGDVHIIATTKEYNYSLYFTVQGKNDPQGKPIVYMVSTARLLKRYGRGLQKRAKDIHNEQVSMKTFENAHKLD